MRVLLVQNMPYAPAYGGANRANRIMLEQLAARGHDCQVLAPLATTAELLRAYLAGRGAQPASDDGDAFGYTLGGVRVRAVTAAPRLVREVRRAVGTFAPDWVLVPGEDPGGMMLGAAFAAAPRRVVYLAYTLQHLPFGPRAFFPSAASTRLVRQAAATVTISRSARDHLARWGGVRAELIYPQVYGAGPFPRCAGDAVTLVNPCGYKGIDIFLGLADAFPGVPFLAVPTWGSEADDLRRLRQRANVTVVAPVDDITEVLRRTRVLLVPSLWDETFGFTAVEALLRGVPVLASDVGGLPEAMLGVPHVLPVRHIERYERAGAQPRPVVPAQDLGPWRAALERLLTDEAHLAELRRRARVAATGFVAGIDDGALESLLYRLTAAALAGRQR